VSWWATSRVSNNNKSALFLLDTLGVSTVRFQLAWRHVSNLNMVRTRNVNWWLSIHTKYLQNFDFSICHTLTSNHLHQCGLNFKHSWKSFLWLIWGREARFRWQIKPGTYPVCGWSPVCECVLGWKTTIYAIRQYTHTHTHTHTHTCWLCMCCNVQCWKSG